MGQQRTDDAAAETDGTRTATVEESAPKATMREFSHGNPYTDETFGDEMAFERGPAVAADGGERNGASRVSSDHRSDGGERNAARDAEQTMADVDHEHPHDDAADANTVFERGTTTSRTDWTASDTDGTASGTGGAATETDATASGRVSETNREDDETV